MAQTERDSQRRLGRPPEVNSVATRAALLTGARQTFAEYGYDATTNRAIAEVAGVTAGAIYHYFPSKADLYVAVFLELQDRFESSFEAAIASHTSLIDRYCSLIDDAVELNRHEPTMASFLVASSGEIRSHPELKQRLSGTKLQRNDWLRRLAHDATQREEMGADVDAQALEDLLGVVLSGLARFAHLAGDPRRHRAAADVLKRFLRGELVT